ncbi:helicase-related protein, partial [Alphaproteobacteria bacterium]|nr:helicase-related protein [Alphaproteobacteria bacterium]
NVVIINPNIEALEPNTNNSYLEDIITGYEIYTINRSDIILKEKLNSLKAIYNQINPETPFSNYYLDEDKIKNFKLTNISSSSPKSLKITSNTSLDDLSKMSNSIYFHTGNNPAPIEKEFHQKLKINTKYGGNFYFNKTVISKDYLFDGIIHLNKNSYSTKKTNLDTIINFNDLSLGDAVVHQKHGIGRFVSIDNIEVSNRIREFIRLIYRGNDKLLLPIENLNFITRYGFDDSSLLLDKLGTNDWLLRKTSVKKKIKFLANKLLKNAAKRSTINIREFQYNNSDLEKFNKQFPFVETEDQLNSIEQSLNDLRLEKPANRLICGDVGFGKTEVALRIACATYLSGFQFVIVVPTTLLAMQHSNTFNERFSIFNIKVASLSRFTSAKDKKEILLSLKSGDVQVLIATHSLFKKDIEFNNLGTLVIDEEQKFGVDQKEYLINKYPNIHLFSLSATPIPRTLQMSLLGLKDLSVIGTPPSNRISIRTYVQKYESVALLSAIKNELERDGQIFIVVPRISHIPFVESEIKKLNIELSYGVGHSKMKEKDIEDVFISFTKGEIQCLISTNIIESGIDIKNANTLIIFNSNLFGLSQLYQLRGRVGRSNKRAYAYLFHDSEKLINKTALKKLQVLANYENLGSNFQLANEDLEIRGAGNLLGDEQSGHVKDIGIELYQSMLKEEVERQKNNNSEIEDDYEEFEFDAFFEYYIPKTYISDDISRLIIYRKFTNSKNIQELKS